MIVYSEASMKFNIELEICADELDAGLSKHEKNEFWKVLKKYAKSGKIVLEMDSETKEAKVKPAL
jgi:hypothetical protein